MTTPFRHHIASGRPFTMLGVWAHPDDEAYLSATLMRRITAVGGRVIVATATRGEAGSAEAGGSPLADLRERELRDALAIVGVTDVRFLGLADGACDEADPATMSATIARLLLVEQPDLVVTFGPDGITGHPDHRAVSRWTLDAWQQNPTGRVLLATMTDEFVERNRDFHDLIGMSMGPPLQSVDRSELVAEIVATPEERRVKAAMLDAHASQTSALIDLVGRHAFETWWTDEMFRSPTGADLSWAADALHASARHAEPTREPSASL